MPLPTICSNHKFDADTLRALLMFLHAAQSVLVRSALLVNLPFMNLNQYTDGGVWRGSLVLDVGDTGEDVSGSTGVGLTGDSVPN